MSQISLFTIITVYTLPYICLTAIKYGIEKLMTNEILSIHMNKISDGFDEAKRGCDIGQRKNATRVLSGEGIACIKYMV